MMSGFQVFDVFGAYSKEKIKLLPYFCLVSNLMLDLELLSSHVTDYNLIHIWSHF